MSFMDTIKDKLGMAKGKAGGLAQQHGDKIDTGIDKGARAADARTGGKHGDKIGTAADKAKDASRKLGDQGRQGGAGGQGGQGTGGTF